MDMICTCGDDGMRKAIELRLDVQRRLGVARMDDVWTAAVLSLAWNFGHYVEIASDMWFGVSVSDDAKSSLYVECDWPFDGVFALWRVLADRFPEKLIAIGDARDNSATREFCAAKCAEHEALRNVSLAHDYACPMCSIGHVDRVSINLPYGRCEEGKALWDAYFPPMLELRDVWGSPNYENAPWMWGERQLPAPTGTGGTE